MYTGIFGRVEQYTRISKMHKEGEENMSCKVTIIGAGSVGAPIAYT